VKDAEIKKALEKAINEYAAEDVGSPKYFKLIIAILDLFNRQQAEIEALQMDNGHLQSDVINANMNLEHMTAEVERLKYNLEAVLNERADHSEAIKEYKNKVENDIVTLFGKSNCTEFIECLDYRYKEMVGE
jgi:chromosome segregation ATPase